MMLQARKFVVSLVAVEELNLIVCSLFQAEDIVTLIRDPRLIQPVLNVLYVMLLLSVWAWTLQNEGLHDFTGRNVVPTSAQSFESRGRRRR